ncbi:hypothetical protein ACSDQ9_03850 [Aestuariimicrobium soli]|uniref:hypothetical protein n=1 Tax=Aestuariimicrobium soli TaxID=2035834 RepID=UPI003EBB4BF9
MSDTDLRERFARLDEPEPFDPDVVVRAAQGRKTRRDVLTLAGGTLGVAALGTAGVTLWQQLSGQPAVPAGPVTTPLETPSGGPTINSSADAPTAPPPNSGDPDPSPAQGSSGDAGARGWPTSGLPAVGTLYRVTGNLGFMMVAEGWEWWDLSARSSLRHGSWALGTPTQTVVGSEVMASTEPIGGRNHYGLLLPTGAQNVMLTWAAGPEIMLLLEQYDLPTTTGLRLFFWSEDPAQVSRYGGFQLAFTMAGESNATTVRLSV